MLERLPNDKAAFTKASDNKYNLTTFEELLPIKVEKDCESETFGTAKWNSITKDSISVEISHEIQMKEIFCDINSKVIKSEECGMDDINVNGEWINGMDNVNDSVEAGCGLYKTGNITDPPVIFNIVPETADQ